MSTPPNDNSPQWGNPGNPGYPAGPQTPGNPYSGQPAGQPGGQPSKFGTEAYNPGAGYGAPMEEPNKFRTLKTLTLASLGVYVLSQIFGLMSIFTPESEQAIRDQFAAMNMPVTDDDINAAMAFSVGLAVVLTVIAVGLYLLVYFGLRAKKNWARITGVVLAILGTVFTVGGLLMDSGAMTSGMGLVSLALTVAWVALNIYWLVLAFNGQVKAYLEQFNR